MTYRDVAPIVKKFMFSQPFFGHLLMRMRKEISTKVPTAAVAPDGDTFNIILYINPDFWGKLNPGQQEGILFHETLHVAFGHLAVLDQYLIPELANIAMDMEINQYIERKNLPDGAVMYNEEPFKELNLPTKKGTRFYYDAIANEQAKNPKFRQAVQKVMQGNPSDHGQWKAYDDLSSAAKKMFKSQQEHAIKEAYEDTDQKSIGNLPGGLQKQIDELFKKKPEVFNWKAYFRKFIGTVPEINRKKTLKRASKRFDGLPGLKTKRRVKIFVSIDTSGSVGMSELAELFEQIDHVWRAGAVIHCVTWDTIIHDEFEYKGKLPKEINGGGGSDIGIAIKKYNENKRDYTCAVHFTDGYVHNDQKLYGRHLFVITSNGSKFDPGGPHTMMQIPQDKGK